MNIFEEAEQELGMEPGELEGTFPPGFFRQCRHYAWYTDEEGVDYCTYCDVNLSEKEGYKENGEKV